MGYESFEIWSAVKQVKYRETFELIKTMIISSNGDVNNAISSVLDIVCNSAHSEAGTFWYYSKSGDGLIHARAAYGGGDVSGIYLAYGEGIAGGVIKTGEPTIIADCQADERWAAKSDKKTGFITKSMICVPLNSDSGTFGCIQLINKMDGSLFDDTDFDLVNSLSEEIARQFIKLNILSDGKLENDVTVASIRVKNFCEIAELYEANQSAELINLILSYVTQIVVKYNGVISSYDSDRTIAYWNGEENTFKACEALLEIQEGSDEFSKMVKERYNKDVYFNIGASFGRIFIGNIGTSVKSIYTIVGNTVNEALYVENKCPGKKIYITRELNNKIRLKSKTSKNSMSLFNGEEFKVESFTLESIKKQKSL